MLVMLVPAVTAAEMLCNVLIACALYRAGFVDFNVVPSYNSSLMPNLLLLPSSLHMAELKPFAMPPNTRVLDLEEEPSDTVCDKVLVQVAYAIGVASPVGFYINTYGTAKVKAADGNVLSEGVIAEKTKGLCDMRPFAIVKRNKKKNPIFLETASYGHFGRKPETKPVEVYYKVEGKQPIRKENDSDVYLKDVDFFAWEKLDYVDKIKAAFDIK